MRIRPAIVADTAAIEALLRASYPDLMRGAYPEAVLKQALPLMIRANPSLIASGRYHVALGDAGDIIASGGWSLERPGSGDVVPGLAHIRHFAVHPGHLRRGLARAIFERCHMEAAAAGAERFECYASLNAAPFYAALGFQEIGPFPVELRPGLIFPSLLMVRPI